MVKQSLHSLITLADMLQIMTILCWRSYHDRYQKFWQNWKDQIVQVCIIYCSSRILTFRKSLIFQIVNYIAHIDVQVELNFRIIDSYQYPWTTFSLYANSCAHNIITVIEHISNINTFKLVSTKNFNMIYTTFIEIAIRIFQLALFKAKFRSFTRFESISANATHSSTLYNYNFQLYSTWVFFGRRLCPLITPSLQFSCQFQTFSTSQVSILSLLHCYLLFFPLRLNKTWHHWY